MSGKSSDTDHLNLPSWPLIASNRSFFVGANSAASVTESKPPAKFGLVPGPTSAKSTAYFGECVPWLFDLFPDIESWLLHTVPFTAIGVPEKALHTPNGPSGAEFLGPRKLDERIEAVARNPASTGG